MMKGNSIPEAVTYLNGITERDVMEESMLNTLIYLQSRDMNGQAMPEYGQIELRFGGSGFPLTMKIDFDADRRTAVTSILMLASCSEERRAVLSELLHRINFVMVLGQWRFDPKDGECLIRYTHFIGDTPLSPKQAERMVEVCLVSAHLHEGTIIPLMMGRDPEMDIACSEYKAMMGVEDEFAELRELLKKAAEAKRRNALREHDSLLEIEEPQENV